MISNKESQLKKQRPYKKWTELEIKLIYEKYGKIPNKELAVLLDRAPDSIQLKASTLGLTSKKISRKWTEEENQLLH
ncbi:MAG: hypothetical protein ACXAEI_15235, partial [Candidatus Hodarchaeales archaeon]